MWDRLSALKAILVKFALACGSDRTSGIFRSLLASGRPRNPTHDAGGRKNNPYGILSGHASANLNTRASAEPSAIGSNDDGSKPPRPRLAEFSDFPFLLRWPCSPYSSTSLRKHGCIHAKRRWSSGHAPCRHRYVRKLVPTRKSRACIAREPRVKDRDRRLGATGAPSGCSEWLS